MLFAARFTPAGLSQSRSPPIMTARMVTYHSQGPNRIWYSLLIQQSEIRLRYIYIVNSSARVVARRGLEGVEKQTSIRKNARENHIDNLRSCPMRPRSSCIPDSWGSQCLHKLRASSVNIASGRGEQRYTHFR